MSEFGEGFHIYMYAHTKFNKNLREISETTEKIILLIEKNW